jgi:hypothetical protein
MIEQRGRWRMGVRGAVGVGNGVGGHDASERGGSVRRLSDVRGSKPHVGYAQEGAPD